MTEQSDGCNYGHANRYSLGTLIVLLGIGLSLLTWAVTSAQEATATELQRFRADIVAHAERINQGDVTSGRIDERLRAMQQTLDRIEKQLGKGTP